MNSISINDLVSQTMAAMKERGLKDCTIWSEYGHSFQPIVHRIPSHFSVIVSFMKCIPKVSHRTIIFGAPNFEDSSKLRSLDLAHF